MRLFKVPKFAKYFYKKRIWGFSVNTDSIFLTFDDGPHPAITPFVLDFLKEKNIKANFFCVGENVSLYPEIFQRILAEGHQVGNHTFRHENSKKVSENVYLNSISKANDLIKSKLFRPPYGVLNSKLAQIISKEYRIVMWSWSSYDFDENVSLNKILKSAKKIKAGDILVLHDNPKFSAKLKMLLPDLIAYLVSQKFDFKRIESLQD
jgi:peptidoglycan/xylan/chitin deacetylase (PgdA/CDA1 family)